MKILFLGSSRFSLLVLKKMIEEGLDISMVITGLDKPSGRGHKVQPNVVKTFAIEKNIPYFQSQKLRNEMDNVKTFDYDIAVVASFGQILSEDFLNFKPVINVHPSLLPLYRGPSPIQTALLNGDEKTGVTIMKVAKEVDSGDILLQKEYIITKDDYYDTLEEKLANIGGELVCNYINNYNSIEPAVQNHHNATFTRKFTKEDGLIDLNMKSVDIENLVKALADNVGCNLKINQEFVKIYKVQPITDCSCEKGQVLNDKKHFIIGTEEGCIEILSLKSSSGKMISGRDYLNGHSEFLGRNLL